MDRRAVFCAIVQRLDAYARAEGLGTFDAAFADIAFQLATVVLPAPKFAFLADRNPTRDDLSLIQDELGLLDGAVGTNGAPQLSDEQADRIGRYARAIYWAVVHGVDLIGVAPDTAKKDG